MLAIFESIGLPEIIIILFVVLLLFGAKRLPEMARSLGRSSREFKKGMREGADDEADAEESGTDKKASEVSPD